MAAVKLHNSELIEKLGRLVMEKELSGDEIEYIRVIDGRTNEEIVSRILSDSEYSEKPSNDKKKCEIATSIMNKLLLKKLKG